MRKNRFLIFAIIVVSSLCALYLWANLSSTPTPSGKYRDPYQKIQMRVSIEGDAISAKIKMRSIEENSNDKGFVKIPYTKYFLAQDVQVNATSTRADQDITCKILDIDGKVLSKDGPSQSVYCHYGTF